MTKPLDKQTKAELLAHIHTLQAQVQTLGSKNAQLIADKTRLRAELEELEAQREDGTVTPYRDRLRAWCTSHPHVRVRQTPKGAINIATGELVVGRE